MLLQGHAPTFGLFQRLAVELCNRRKNKRHQHAESLIEHTKRVRQGEKGNVASANVRATLSMCKFLSRWALRRVEKIAKGSVRRNQNAAHTDMIGKALRKLFRSVSAVAYVSVG